MPSITEICLVIDEWMDYWEIDISDYERSDLAEKIQNSFTCG